MKKIIFMSSLLLLLGACSSNEETSKEEQPKEEVNEEQQKPKSEMSQEELNELLKEEATKAEFVELNVDNPPNGKSVYVDGEVSLLTEGVISTMSTFTLTSKEDSGNGFYYIDLINTTDEVVSEGDQVRVYGTVDGKDENGMPKITATIVEKN